MKKTLLFLLIIISVSTIFGQEIELRPTAISTAGINSGVNLVNITKWQLGEVHLLVINNDDLITREEMNWSIETFPNPFNQFLHLNFQDNEKSEFIIHLTDLSGKNLLFKKEEVILPNETIKLDLNFLTPAIYLLTVRAKNQNVQKVFKVQKH